MWLRGRVCLSSTLSITTHTKKILQKRGGWTPCEGVGLSSKYHTQDRKKRGNSRGKECTLLGVWRSSVSQQSGRLRQKDHKFEPNLGNVGRSYLQKVGEGVGDIVQCKALWVQFLVLLPQKDLELRASAHKCHSGCASWSQCFKSIWLQPNTLVFMVFLKTSASLFWPGALLVPIHGLCAIALLFIYF